VNSPVIRRKIWKTAVAVLLLNGLLVMTAAPSLWADEHDRCRHRIEKAEAKLDHAVAKHGEHSRQAEEKRRDLRAERERCWNEYHGWWDGHNHQWHTDRDWDHDSDH